MEISLEQQAHQFLRPSKMLRAQFENSKIYTTRQSFKVPSTHFAASLLNVNSNQVQFLWRFDCANKGTEAFQYAAD